MKGVFVPLICLGVFNAHADLPLNEYEAIPRRNPFGLKEKAPAPAPKQEERPIAESRVVLNGITTILGSRQALLQLIPPQPKPGEQPESLILAEGQSEGPLKVLRINEDEGWVRIANAGRVTMIRFEDPPPASIAGAQGGATSPGSALSGSNSSVLAARALPTNAPTGAPGLNPPTAELRHFPMRPPRTQTEVPSLGTPSTSLSTVSTSATGVAVSPLPSTPTPPATTSQQLTPEEQSTLMQIEQQLGRDQPVESQPSQQQVETPPPIGANQPYLYHQSPPPALPSKRRVATP